MEKRYIVAEQRLIIIGSVKKELKETLKESAAHCCAVGMAGRHDTSGLAALECLEALKEKDLLSLSKEELLTLEEEAGPRNTLLADLYFRLATA